LQKDGRRLALAIRHVHYENCGTLEDVLLERGPPRAMRISTPGSRRSSG
jgi:hypothetical protein